MYIDPIMFNWILIGAASACAGMIGYHFGKRSNEDTIADTITFLAREGFLKSYENEDGELELVKLNDDPPK
mgnify:FL=1